MNAPEFVYVIYIAATPGPRLASPDAAAVHPPVLVRPLRRIRWCAGSVVNYWIDEARSDLDFSGKALRSEPPRLLSYTFGVEWGRWVRDSAAHKDMLHEPPSRVTFELEPMGDATRLRLVHDRFEPGSTSLQGVSRGWPGILSGLKSVLEGGTSLLLDPDQLG